MTRWQKARAFLRGLTVLFGGRPLTHQHAGANDLFVRNTSSRAARHFTVRSNGLLGAQPAVMISPY